MDKNYNLYYLSRIVSGIGDALQEIAIVTIIAVFADSTIISGMIITLNALVRVVCSLFAIKVSIVKNSKKALANLNFLYAFTTALFYIVLLVLSFDSQSQFLKLGVISYETICSVIYTFYKIYQDVIVKEVCNSNEKIARLYATDNIVQILTSLASSLFLIFMSFRGFLFVNMISFLMSGFMILKIDTDFSECKSQISKTDKPRILGTINKFYKAYPSVIKIIFLSSFLTFFFSSYSVLFQASIKLFNINLKNIGIINAIYYISCIFMAYISGYLNTKHVSKLTLSILFTGFLFSILCLTANKWVVLFYLLFLYPLVGSGYNTIAQIYFQNEVSRDDIPILKGIYNVVCGVMILFSGILTPSLVRAQNPNKFFISMSLLFLFLTIWLCAKKRSFKVGNLT